MFKFDGNFKSNLFLFGAGMALGYFGIRYVDKYGLPKIFKGRSDTDFNNIEVPLDTTDMGPFAVEQEEVEPIVFKDANAAYAVSAGAIADVKAVGAVSVNQLIELANIYDNSNRPFVRDGDRILWTNVQDLTPRQMSDGSYYVGALSALKFPEETTNEE